MSSDAYPALAAWKRLEAVLREEGHTHSEVRFDMGNFALVWAHGFHNETHFLAISHASNGWWGISEHDEYYLMLAAPFAAAFVTRVRQLNAIAQDPANAVALIDAATKTL